MGDQGFLEKRETLSEILDREQFEMDAQKAAENAKPLMDKMNREFREMHQRHVSQNDGQNHETLGI